MGLAQPLAPSTVYMHFDSNRSEPENDLPSASHELLNRICAGDRDAQSDFVQLWVPLLTSYFQHRIPGADCELLTVIVLEKFLHKVAAGGVQLDKNPAPLIWHMAKEKAIETLRTLQRAQKLTKELEAQVAQQRYRTIQSGREFKENLSAFHRIAIEKGVIEVEHAEAIMLRISGLKDKEITQMLGVSRSRICQMRSEYRDRIERWLSRDQGGAQAFGDLLST